MCMFVLKCVAQGRGVVRLIEEVLMFINGWDSLALWCLPPNSQPVGPAIQLYPSPKKNLENAPLGLIL